MRSSNVFSKAVKTAVAAAFVASSLVSGMTAASAVTAAPTTGYDTQLVSSGSDTTYDMMKALGKVYSGSNGCATIWTSGQPKDGSCSTADTDSGNGTDKTNFPWVNDGHAVTIDLYPVGSGNGTKELCAQGQTGVRQVNIARASSNKATGSDSCSDTYAVAYAKDAVSWWHATKDASGNDTITANIASIDKATLTAIYDGSIIQWSELNNRAGVTDAAGALITGLPASFIDVYDVQMGSGTREFFHSSSLIGGSKTTINLGSLTEAKLTAAGYTGTLAEYKTAHNLSTVQENAPSAIFADGKENTAIYYMSLGRYKQSAGITGTDLYYGNATGDADGRDSLGQIGRVEPKDSTVLDSTFVGNRFVYNILRYPSAETLKYAGPKGFLCSATIGAIKDRITGKTYRSLVSGAITAEGFTPLAAGTTGGTLDNAGLTSSYCRVTDGTVQGAADTAAPTVGVKTGATFTGLASATFEYNKPVRSFDATKIVVTNSEGTVLTSADYTVSCYNQKTVAVASCNAGTVDTDPYQITAIKGFTIALKSAITGTVSYSVQAASAKSLAGVNATAAATASTTADTTAPVATVATSTHSGLASIKYTFGEPVRVDASKFSAEGTVASETAAGSGVLGTVVSGTQAVTLAYLDANGAVISYSAATAAADKLQTSVAYGVRVTVNAAASSVIFTAAAGAATDLSNNATAAVTTKPSAIADLGAGVSVKGAFATGESGTKAKQAKTYTVKGSSISISLTGTANIFVDGVQVYNAAAVVNNAAVAAVLNKDGSVKTPAKAQYYSYTAAGKNFAAGTFTLGASTAISAGGTATTRTNPDALSSNAAWAGSGWHTVKVVVVTAPVAVTALSAS